MIDKKASEEREVLRLKTRMEELPKEIAEVTRQIDLAKKAYDAAAAAHDQRAVAYLKDLNNLYKKAAGLWYKGERQKAEVARQGVEAEELKKLPQTEQVLQRLRAERWTPNGKPDRGEINTAFADLMDPTKGVDSILKDMLYANSSEFPELDKYLRGLGRPATDADVITWLQTNKDPNLYRNLQVQTASDLLRERWNHGGRLRGHKRISNAEAEYIFKQPWGKEALNKMAEDNEALKALKQKLVDQGQMKESDNVLDYVLKQRGNGGALGLFALILAGINIVTDIDWR